MDTWEIVVTGHLSEARARRTFEGLTVTALPDGQSVISGPIVDQSALFGVLHRILELNLPLVSVRKLGEPSIDER